MIIVSLNRPTLYYNTKACGYHLKDLRKYANQIHEALKYLHAKNLSQRRKRQEETSVCFENMQIVYSDEEKINNYKEIDPYKRRSKPEKGNLK